MPDPRKIICIGLNYSYHAAESGVAPPPEPVLFSKYPTALVGHLDKIVLPKVSNQVDYEAELVVAIGQGGRHIPQEKAFEHVGGYTVGHDVSRTRLAALQAIQAMDGGQDLRHLRPDRPRAGHGR